MPATPGETLLTTLFADVHYFFSDDRSASKPQHHRFDRQSYVYLYNNSALLQSRLEIANHAGTPAQDAFFGYLSLVQVQQSYLQPNLVSVSVNTSAIQDHATWHLPAYNEKNEQKYLYKIYSLDLYFWTEKDAASFIGHLRSVISSDRLRIKENPAAQAVHAEHRDSMSPVVQQLERTAIGAQVSSRTGSTVSSASLPGPPAAPPPVAYNPAAPAAPEPVTYREKTPPPPDDGSGTGLKAAAKYDSVPQSQYGSAPGAYHSSYQTPPQFSGPPSAVHHPSSTGMQSPPAGQPSFGPMAASTIANSPPPGHHASAQSTPLGQPSFGPMAASTIPTSPPPSQQSFARQPSGGLATTQYANYPQHQQYQQYPNQPGTLGHNPNLPPTPSAPPPYSGGIPPPPIQQQSTPPVGGYSAYSYGQNPAHGGYTGEVHSQLYRPTEEEAAHGHGHGHGHGHPVRHNTSSSNPNQGEEGLKLSDSTKRLEGKMAKYMNKLDKLW